MEAPGAHAPCRVHVWHCHTVAICYQIIFFFIIIGSGDQIDARYQRQMEEIIELTGNPETAYTTFLYVVENLFNWDGNGIGE